MTPEPTISKLLDNVTRSIDLDLATTIADILNIYAAALKRNANRSILGPEDAVHILSIINIVQKACAGEGDPELIPGRPTNGRTIPDPPQGSR